MGLFRDYVSEKADISPGNVALTESYLKTQDRRMKATRANTTTSSTAVSNGMMMSRREKAARTIQRALALNVENKKRARGELPDEDKRKGNLMDRVVQAFHFAALRKHVREEKAFLKAVERNKFREMENEQKMFEEQRKKDEIFPPLKKSKKHLLKPMPSTSTLSFSPAASLDNKTSTNSSASLGRPGRTRPVDPDIFGLPPIDGAAAQKRHFMDAHTAKYLTPRHNKNPTLLTVENTDKSQSSSSASTTSVNDVAFSLSSSASSSSQDYRRKVTDLSPRHKFKNKHSPY